MIEPHTKHIYNADLNDPWHYRLRLFSAVPPLHIFFSTYGLSKTNIVYHPKDTTIQTSQNIRQPLMNILEHPDASEAAVMGNFYLFLDQLIQNAAHQSSKVLTRNVPTTLC